MANASNTSLAYPCVCSVREKDKIFSEEVSTSIIKCLLEQLDVKACWIGETNTTETQAESPKLIIDGYYFEISENIDLNTTYRFYTKQITDEFGQPFKIMYVDQNGEMLFKTDQSIEGAEKSTTLTLNTNSNIKNIHKQSIKTVIDENPQPTFFIEEADSTGKAPKESNAKTYMIWVKKDTMNPYVYVNESIGWTPLGAVYK